MSGKRPRRHRRRQMRKINTSLSAFWQMTSRRQLRLQLPIC
jgi:hypothetical protein